MRERPTKQPSADSDASDLRPLAYNQRAIWFLQQLDPERRTFNIGFAVHLRSEVDGNALRRALQGVIDRHPALRTSYHVVNGEPYQAVQPHQEVAFEAIDAADWREEKRELEIRRFVELPFDLSQGRVFRSRLYDNARDHSILQIVVHHIAMDGWSLWLIIDDLRSLYEAELGIGKTPREPRKQYTDFVAWQRELIEANSGESSRAYWREQLSGAVTSPAIPGTHAESSDATFQEALVRFTVDEKVSEALRQMASERGTTLYETLLAALYVLLYRYTDHDDLIVATPVAGRSHARFARVVGHFVNVLALRTAVAPEESFTSLLEKVADNVRDALAHQHFPFALLPEIVDRGEHLNQSRLTSVGLNLLRPPRRLHDLIVASLDLSGASEIEFGGVTVAGLDVNIGYGIGGIDLNFQFVELEHILSGEISFNSDLYSRETIVRLSRQFVQLLESLALDPSGTVGTVPFIPPAEQNRFLNQWTESPLDPPALLHEMVEKQVELHPGRRAASHRDTTLSYEQLNSFANQLARLLRSRGIRQGDLVAIATHRSLESAIAMLAVLKAGAAFMPLDPSLPEDRIRFMLEDAGAALILAQKEIVARLPASPADLFLLDEGWPELAAHDGANLDEVAVEPHDLAYVMYTSGSTGQPKGVQITHGSVANFVRGMQIEPGMSIDDVVLAITTFSFDISILEIFLPLSVGAAVVIADHHLVTDGEALLRTLRERDITYLQATPTTWLMLIRAGWRDTPTLRTALSGGEALARNVADAILSRGVTLWNMYGPTETTIWSTLHPVSAGSGPVPIGRPIRNTQLYVLDRQQQLVPHGVPGELYIGGAGLAAGYINRPELTAERFPTLRLDPAREEKRRLYRTGDRVRFGADGTLHFLGRADRQVKIRGFRIELDEIETVLSTHPQVDNAAAVLFEESGDKQIVAYLIVSAGESPPSTDALRSFLGKWLPKYMLPARFVFLDAFPLTPNKKVDRSALPAPDLSRPALTTQYTPPSTPLEEELAAIWRDVLQVEQVGIHDDFFDLGGHSLLATQIASRVERATGTALPLRQLFSEPTIAAIAQFLQEAQASESAIATPPITPAPRTEMLPLSFAQERMWFLHRLAPNNAAYHIPLALHLDHRIDRPTLQRALDDLARRHEALRTVFPTVDGAPYQKIIDDFNVEIDELDLSPAASAGGNVELDNVLKMLGNQAFDLTEAPPWRCTVVNTGSGGELLHLNFHHIISDQWSLVLFLQEVIARYRAYAEGQDVELPALEIQYGDFAVWQRQWLQGQAADTLLDYWRSQLAGLPPLDMLTDFPRPPVQTFRGATLFQPLPEEIVDNIHAASRRLQASPFMLMFAAFKLLLSRYSGQDDFAVGIPVANRHRLAVEPIIGLFVNTLVVRTNLDGDPTFVQLLEQVRQTLLDSYVHQEMPFEKLVDEIVHSRDLSRTPLVQVLFNIVNAPFDRERPIYRDIELTLYDRGAAQFDLSFSVVIDPELPLEQHIAVEYNTDLYREDTIRRLLDHYQRLLENIVADPDRPLSAYPLLSPSEEEQILYQWNQTEMAYPRDRRLHELVADQAARTPTAGAVTFGDETVTYEELDRRANQLAHHLLQKGVRPDDVVGVFVERSAEMVVALLGILKAGAAYLPLDPDFPADRLLFMVEDAGVKVIVTQERLVGVSPVTHVEHVIRLDRDWASIATGPTTAPAVTVPPESRAYLIYTSGSTGKPKGVQIEHRNVVNFIAAMQEAPGMAPDDVLLAVTTLSFDISILEIFLPLATGARVVVADGQSAGSGPGLLRALRRYEATVMQATPTTWKLLVDAGWDDTPALRRALCGGEALPRDLANAILERDVALWNMYGPTETTIWSAIHQVQPGSNRVPIGRPIGNNTFYILDDRGQPAPMGVAGELYIGGEGVARGYLNRPALNAERFVPDPFTRFESTGRMYRTGDVARYLADGTVQYLGRVDFQVKLHGHRIELGEIEVMLTDFPGVRAAVVTVYGSGSNQRLVAYLRLGEDAEQPTHSQLREHLRQDLPDYMVPSAYVFLDAFPLTPNRKIDRNALPAPDLARPELANEYTPPRNALETVLADIMTAVLDLDQVGVHDDFFELGGHSLQATRFVARAGKALRSEIPLWTFLRSPNVAEFAAELAEQEDAARMLRVAELRVRMAQMSPEEIEQLLARRQGADS